MRMMCVLFGMVAMVSPTEAAGKIQFTVTGGKKDMAQVVVTVPIATAIKGEEVGAKVTSADGKTFDAQITQPRPADEALGGVHRLHVLIPQLKAGQTLEMEATFVAKPTAGFAWKDGEGKEPELQFNGRSVLRYVRPDFDPKATPAKQQAIANPTIKVFHHLYAADGKTVLTNGPQGQYPHHRGIYFGFNNISYDGKKADIWHCRTGEHQSHHKFLAREEGALLGRHSVQVNWHGQDDAIFATEQRELTVFHALGGTLIEFQSALRTERDKVRLDGDPQHAGFHFRANSEMEKSTKETYFLRPDGKGEMGNEKNWLPKDRSGPKNLPWNAMSFALGGKRYTVVYLDHPTNPKEARQSERCYGRIGTYFEYDLTKATPLKVQYRLWVQEGELTVEQCEAMSQAFTTAPVVKVTSK